MSSHVISVARNAASLTAGKRATEYTKVILHVTDDVSYTVGNDLGLTMEYTHPFGTPEMARNILASISGYQHQSYDATSVLLDPAAQLGDGLDINGLYSSIVTMTSHYGPHFTADTGAPAIQEINQKVQFKSSQERQVERKFLETYAKLAIQADQISAEVEARKSDVEQLNSLLAIQANQIAAKVSQTGGNPASFAFEMYAAYMRFLANYKEILRLDASGATLNGIINALGGTIGGFTILSDYLTYNNQKWGGTNTIGLYLGVNGLQLGRNCKIDMQGNADFTSANIRGTLRAGDLIYGGDAGYLSGSGLESHTVAGNRLQYNTVSTSYTSGGINTSLGYADYANGVFNGWNKAYSILANTMHTTYFYLDGRNINLRSTTVANPDGSSKTIRYLSW